MSLMDYTHRNAKKIGLVALICGSTLTLSAGAASYAYSELENKYKSRVYATLATVSLAATGLGALIIREESYNSGNSPPKHKQIQSKPTKR